MNKKEKRKGKQRKEHVILPCYLEETFKFAPHCGIKTRNKLLKSLFARQTWGRKLFHFFGSSLWNSLPKLIKKPDN